MATTARDPGIDLDAVIEDFITHPVPYLLGERRAEVRNEVRSLALAHLLGDLAELIETGTVTAETVSDAIRLALTAATDEQHAQTGVLLATAA